MHPRIAVAMAFALGALFVIVPWELAIVLDMIQEAMNEQPSRSTAISRQKYKGVTAQDSDKPCDISPKSAL